MSRRALVSTRRESPFVTWPSALATKVALLFYVGLWVENMAMTMNTPVPWKGSWDVHWEDDFRDGLRSWDYELADAWQYGFNQFGNFEQQFYTKDAVKVENGVLKITAQYHEDPAVVEQLCWAECYDRCVAAGKVLDTPDFQGCMDGCGNTGNRCKNLGQRGITSGRIHAKEGVVIPPSKYPAVRLEARVRLPEPGLGLWPAFWALPPKKKGSDAPGKGVYGSWPRSGEIDVLETANSFDFLNGTVHYGTLGNRRKGSAALKSFDGGDGAFHVYGVEWRKDVFKWYVDGVFYGAVPSPGKPFDVPFMPILNLAVGGNFTEYNAGRTITVEDAQRTLRGKPRTMEVDYVRVWTKRAS